MNRLESAMQLLANKGSCIGIKCLECFIMEPMGVKLLMSTKR